MPKAVIVTVQYVAPVAGVKEIIPAIAEAVAAENPWIISFLLLSTLVMRVLLVEGASDANVVNEIYNICGGYEQSNIDTVSKILFYYNQVAQISDYINLSFNREGQDVRYALDDSKLRALGWSPKKDFDTELPKIIEYYKNNFIW